MYRINTSGADVAVKFQSVHFMVNWFKFATAGVALLATGSAVAGTNLIVLSNLDRWKVDLFRQVDFVCLAGKLRSRLRMAMTAI